MRRLAPSADDQGRLEARLWKTCGRLVHFLWTKKNPSRSWPLSATVAAVHACFVDRFALTVRCLRVE
jgi:hypothetical protein